MWHGQSPEHDASVSQELAREVSSSTSTLSWDPPLTLQTPVGKQNVKKSGNTEEKLTIALAKSCSVTRMASWGLDSLRLLSFLMMGCAGFISNCGCKIVNLCSSLKLAPCKWDREWVQIYDYKITKKPHLCFDEMSCGGHLLHGDNAGVRF